MDKAQAAASLTAMEGLAERNWCVVLKKLPKNLGWLMEGSRSEYDAPVPDRHICRGKWLAEAHAVRTDVLLMTQTAFGDTAFDAVMRLNVLCAQEESRHSPNVAGERPLPAKGKQWMTWTEFQKQHNAGGQSRREAAYSAPPCSPSDSEGQ